MWVELSTSYSSIWPCLALTCHPSWGRGPAHCTKRQARYNLIGDSLRQPFQGCILRRDGGIFGTHHVYARVRPGGNVEHNGALANFHELITGAERTPFTRDRVVSAHAESLNVVIQPDNQPLTVRCAGHGRPPTRDGVAHQPARLPLTRRNLNIAQ